MIAGDDGEGKLAGNHFIALARRRHFDRQHALVRIDLRQVRDEAVDMLVTLRRIFGRHALARMLPDIAQRRRERTEEHTSELQSLMRISYAVFCMKKKSTNKQ